MRTWLRIGLVLAVLGMAWLAACSAPSKSKHKSRHRVEKTGSGARVEKAVKKPRHGAHEHNHPHPHGLADHHHHPHPHPHLPGPDGHHHPY